MGGQSLASPGQVLNAVIICVSVIKGCIYGPVWVAPGSAGGGTTRLTLLLVSAAPGLGESQVPSAQQEDRDGCRMTWTQHPTSCSSSHSLPMSLEQPLGRDEDKLTPDSHSQMIPSFRALQNFSIVPFVKFSITTPFWSYKLLRLKSPPPPPRSGVTQVHKWHIPTVCEVKTDWQFQPRPKELQIQYINELHLHIWGWF